MQQLERELRNFIVTNFMFGEDQGLRNDDSLLDKEVIDSTGVLELVLHLEETYGIDVGDNELIPEHLDSVDNLVRFVTWKQQPRPEEQRISTMKPMAEIHANEADRF